MDRALPRPPDDPIELEVHVGVAEAGLFGGEVSRLTVGRYELRGVLGVGGLGVVYDGWDLGLARPVAVKLLHPRGEAGSSLVDEAQAMARLAHPNVVAVYDVGVDDGRVFLAMERVVGSTLRVWARGRATSDVLVAWRAAGAGLAAAHLAGLVHRDFKPENVLVGDDGRVRVTDFGLAGPRGSGVGGTPAYMAPEQREGAATAVADQYAWCVTLLEALGERGGGHVRRVLSRGASEVAAERWPSMEELFAALDADPVTVWARRAAVVLVGVVLSAALIGAVLQGWMFWAWWAR